MMNIKPFFSKCQIAGQLVILTALLFLFATPAFLSREYVALSGYWHEAGQMIRRISGPFPDLFEHFSSGAGLTFMASIPLWLLIQVLPVWLSWIFQSWKWAARKIATKVLTDTEQKRREWLLNSSLKRDLWVMMTLSPAVPFIASWYWEVRQALGLAAYSYDQGKMQWEQMAADHLGALAGMVILYFLVRHWHRRKLEDA